MNTVMIGATINLYSLVSTQTPLIAIVGIGLALGFFNSLQFSSMNSMAYADIETNEFEHGQHDRQLVSANIHELWSGLRIPGDGLVSWSVSAVRSLRGDHGAASRIPDLGRVDDSVLTLVLDVAPKRWRERQSGGLSDGMTSDREFA